MNVSGARGFTLFELLVVIAIVALLSTLAVLSMEGLGSRRTEHEAERLAALIRFASDEAVLSGRDLGLRIDDGRIGFLIWRLSEDGRELEWVALDDAEGPLRPRTHPADMSFDFGTGTRSTGSGPHLLLPASGELEPFSITVSGTEPGAPRFVVSLDESGAVISGPSG